MEETEIKTKYCKYCAAKIPADAIICTSCGRQVEELRRTRENIVINNTNANVNANVNRNMGGINKKPLNKWVALLLCVFLGCIGGHKFYEGKVGMGILYLFTMGLFGIGVCIDFIVILCRPVNYYA